MTVALYEPATVSFGPSHRNADVTLRMSADVLDRYWRGEYDLLDGLARDEVTASGRLSRVLKVLPELRPLFPVYQAMVATKGVGDRHSAVPS